MHAVTRIRTYVPVKSKHSGGREMQLCSIFLQRICLSRLSLVYNSFRLFTIIIRKEITALPHTRLSIGLKELSETKS